MYLSTGRRKGQARFLPKQNPSNVLIHKINPNPNPDRKKSLFLISFIPGGQSLGVGMLKKATV